MRRIAVQIAAFAGFLALGLALSSAPAAADTVANENQFVVLINQLRASKGLGALSPNAELQSVARAWSAVMAGTGTLAHNPNFPNQVKSNWLMLGENVGVGPTVDELHRAFVASPKHYENLVEPRFNAVGIGIVEVNGTIWVTQNFEQLGAAAPVKAAAAPAPRPAPRPAAAPAPRPAAPAPRPAAAPRATAPPAPAPPPTAAPAPAPPPTPSPAVAPIDHAAPVVTAADADVQGAVFDRSNGPSTMLLGLGGSGALVILAFAVVLARRRRRRSYTGVRV